MPVPLEASESTLGVGLVVAESGAPTDAHGWINKDMGTWKPASAPGQLAAVGSTCSALLLLSSQFLQASTATRKDAARAGLATGAIRRARFAVPSLH